MNKICSTISFFKSWEQSDKMIVGAALRVIIAGIKPDNSYCMTTKTVAYFSTVILCYVLQVHKADDSVIINSTTLTSGHTFACSNETINFHCTVMNTSVLTWTSDEYVGEDQQISFVVGIDRPGGGKKVDQKPTLAQLVNIECSQDQFSCNITSNLQITVLSKSDINIQCESDISFKLINIAYSGM